MTMSREIRIIATTDLHGLFYDGHHTPRPAGSLAGVRHFVNEARKEYPGPLFLADAGDFIGGGLAVWHSIYDSPGATDISPGRVGYDAMAPGNHDLDIGLSRFGRYAAAAGTPMVAANVSGASPYVRPYTVVSRGGVSIGFVGWTTAEAQPLMDSFSVSGDIDSVRKAIDSLGRGPGPDLTVLLAHAGPDECRTILSEVDGFDLAICGHEHSTRGVYTGPGGVPIVNPGPYGLTLADICVDLPSRKAEAKIVSLAHHPCPMPGALVEADARTLIPETAPRSLDEAIHRCVHSLGADISVTDISGITLSGPLTVGQSFRILPYDDRLAYFEVPAGWRPDGETFSVSVSRSIPASGTAMAIATVHTYALMGKPGRLTSVSPLPLRSHLLDFFGR